MSSQADDVDGGPNILEAEDVYVRFWTPRGVVRAVNGVTFHVRRGETVGIAGESGSGKTILARRVMGLVRQDRDTRVSGCVQFEGLDLSAMSGKELARLWGPKIAMIFQDPMASLNPVRRIGVQITESLRRHLDLDRNDSSNRAVELLRLVGLPEPERRFKQYPHELSGGMRQRVLVAIALSCRPLLLFADEPTTALDVTVQAQILNLLKELQEDNQMAMVLVSHDLRVLQGRTDRLMVMYGGEVVEIAPTPMIFAQPRMPYTELLMKSVPPLSGPRHTTFPVIPGQPPELIDPPPGCKFSPRCPYAQERCLDETPPLQSEGPDGHQFRCWYPIGSAAWEKAKRRNRVRGQSAAGTPVGDGEVTV